MVTIIRKVLNIIKFCLFFDKKKFLIIEKGKYIIQNRKDVEIDKSTVLIENDVHSSDAMWTDKDVINNYLYPQRLEFYENVIGIIKGMNLSVNIKIIDVGCGIGYFTNMIHEHLKFDKCIAYDFSQEAVNYIKLNYSTLIAKQGSIHDIEYPDKTYDLVLCMEVLEHIQFVEQAIQELSRICRNDGRILISIPNGEIDNYLGHTNFWSDQSFKNILIAQNLSICKRFFIDRYPYKNFYMVYILRKNN